MFERRTARCGRCGRAKTKFSDLSRAQQAGIVVLGIVEIALLIASERDIHRRPSTEINGSKLRWRLICLINVFGPLSYLRWGRRRTDEG